MALLIQFLMRLSFGLAVGMAITSSQLVTSGYFRNHLYVTLGLTSLAALLSRSVAPAVFWPAAAAALLSYLGSVCWLYEKQAAGRIALVLVATLALYGGWIGLGTQEFRVTAAENFSAVLLRQFSPISSGLLLGMTMASMLLGHWYLNSPTMELAPLRRLLMAMAFAVALQTVVSGLGLWGEANSTEQLSTQWIVFVVLRWAFGLLGVAVLMGMSWQTLKIPNTQSATGILYVAVIGTFVGETMSLLLSTESLFPL